MELTVLSAFMMGAVIPPDYTCDQGISPPLEWSAVPEGTRSIAVLCDDPDAPAGDWVHWVLFNLPPDTHRLEPGIPAIPTLPDGAIQGMNDYEEIGYTGPCPPHGKKHRYYFKVFALDTRLKLTSAAQKKDLLRAMKGHILAQGTLMGTFER
ncbi:MAG TPA: YbhB/YbcL family Raf kinase inhibitor-like protein [Verrucomicrobia bacterium]|nr:MAG: phosphatidylethanolamine-binding protein [Lentisphaerae bacterium GWF2_57_35]HBA83977.1 YbhB/YbcL family Raf kinase inhibitor-like protein [Verrucomicrobiota bacterium]